jgi:hypothetical protein
VRRMKAHPVFWHARLDRLKLRAEQAPPAERARLEAAVLIFGFEAIFGWRDGASVGLKGEVYRAGSIRAAWPWGR